jgi:hypothetical protein
MSLVIEYQEEAVVVKQPEKGKSIVLSGAAWLKLIKLRKEVEEAIEKKEEKKWCLSDSEPLFVHTSVFKDNFYIHIRKWSNERPTGTGVALYPDQWKQELCKYLGVSDEMKLAREVIQTHIQEKLKKLIAEHCQGCEQAWASQKDHDCLMNGRALAQAHIGEAAKPMSYQKFLVKLAQLGLEKKISIRYPWISQLAIYNLYLKDIKKEVLDMYDY